MEAIVFGVGVTVGFLVRSFLSNAQPVERIAIEPEPAPSPNVGEIWALKGEGPWPLSTCRVKILDVKEGWVRYYLSKFYPDLRMKIKTFTDVYQKIEENDDNR